MDRMNSAWKALLPLVLAILFASVGCSAQAPADATPIRIAVLPIVEGLPLYAAQDFGFFGNQGVKVEFIPAGSAAERDQLIAAGQADGMINDLLAVALFNRDAVQLQVVQFAHVSAPGSPLYVIAAAPQSGIKTSKDLAGVEIGISQGSIIDYATNRILSGEGLKADQIKTLAVPKIPDRMSLLLSGQLKAATLPQPFATLALQQGAVAVADDTRYPDIGNSVVSFRKKFIDEHPQAVRGFVEALNQATADVNANPDTYRGLLGKYKVVAEAVAATYPIPKFPAASLPTAKQFEDVVSFALERKLIQNPVSYAGSVNGTFIKK